MILTIAISPIVFIGLQLVFSPYCTALLIIDFCILRSLLIRIVASFFLVINFHEPLLIFYYTFFELEFHSPALFWIKIKIFLNALSFIDFLKHCPSTYSFVDKFPHYFIQFTFKTSFFIDFFIILRFLLYSIFIYMFVNDILI